MAKTKRQKAREAKRLYKVKERIKKWLSRAKYRTELALYRENSKKEMKELERKYKKDRKDIIKRTNQELTSLDLNMFLFWNQDMFIKEKPKNAFDIFIEQWLLKKATTFDFWWIKISKRYFDDLMR